MKFIGLFLLFAFCVIAGFYVYELQSKRLKNSRELALSMNKIKMLFKYSRLDKQKIIESIGFDNYTKLNECSSIDSIIYGIANDYLKSMGSRDYESEKDALELALSQIEIRLNNIEEKYKHSKKLSLSMGLITGLFIVIVLI